MVDSALSQQVEILRGPVTLLYSSGNVAGLVDVADGKIPEKMPENGVSGEAGLRLSSGNLEKLTSAGINIGLGNHFVLHTEGLYRKSGDYAVPRYQKEERPSETPARQPCRFKNRQHRPVLGGRERFPRRGV